MFYEQVSHFDIEEKNVYLVLSYQLKYTNHTNKNSGQVIPIQ